MALLPARSALFPAALLRLVWRLVFAPRGLRRHARRRRVPARRQELVRARREELPHRRPRGRRARRRECAARGARSRRDAPARRARVARATRLRPRAQALKGMDSSEARGVRGRALWYKGDVQRAADELDSLLARSRRARRWAVEIVKLARSGAGRKPFDMSGGLLAVMEMPRTGTASMVVPVEIDGEPALGMIATGTAEAVIDSASGRRAVLGLAALRRDASRCATCRCSPRIFRASRSR